MVQEEHCKTEMFLKSHIKDLIEALGRYGGGASILDDKVAPVPAQNHRYSGGSQSFRELTQPTMDGNISSISRALNSGRSNEYDKIAEESSGDICNESEILFTSRIEQDDESFENEKTVRKESKITDVERMYSYNKRPSKLVDESVLSYNLQETPLARKSPMANREQIPSKNFTKHRKQKSSARASMESKRIRNFEVTASLSQLPVVSENVFTPSKIPKMKNFERRKKSQNLNVSEMQVKATYVTSKPRKTARGKMTPKLSAKEEDLLKPRLKSKRMEDQRKLYREQLS